jgi:hypothetical protein
MVELESRIRKLKDAKRVDREQVTENEGKLAEAQKHYDVVARALKQDKEKSRRKTTEAETRLKSLQDTNEPLITSVAAITESVKGKRLTVNELKTQIL